MNTVKKHNSPHFAAFLTKIHREIHRISYKNSPHLLSNVYSIWIKFRRIIKAVRESWRSGIRSWRHAVGQRLEPVSWSFFCKNTENAVKINNSPRFTPFTAKRCKKYVVKIIFFHRFSPHFLQKFNVKPRPGKYLNLWLSLEASWVKIYAFNIVLFRWSNLGETCLVPLLCLYCV